MLYILRHAYSIHGMFQNLNVSDTVRYVKHYVAKSVPCSHMHVHVGYSLR